MKEKAAAGADRLPQDRGAEARVDGAFARRRVHDQQRDHRRQDRRPAGRDLAPDRQAENPYTFGTIKIAPSLDNKFKKADEFNIMFWIYGAGADAAKKPNIEVEYAFHQKTADGEKFFNKTDPQVMNAETLPPQFDLAAGHQLTGSLAVPLASFPGGRLPPRVEGQRQGQREERDARVDLFGCRAVRPCHPAGRAGGPHPQVRP